MAHQIISIEQIQREAKEAAQRYANVNDACPYAFHTEAGQVFKAAFFIAREEKTERRHRMTWILVSTGRQHQLTGANAFAFGNVPNVREIAHSLAQINRFTGHCSRPYSVAEHSLLVADTAKSMYAASPIVQLAALMHDAHECITGDASSPVKQVLGDVWAAFEEAQQTNLLLHYGLKEAFDGAHDTIKRCDLIALATERRDLTPFDPALHDAWPALDTPGQHVPMRGVNLNSQTRLLMQWDSWANAFEGAANALLTKVFGPSWQACPEVAA